MALPQSFKAMVVTETPEKQFLREIKQKEISDLPAGELIIEVKYSSLNYKDALSASGNKGVTRKYPHTPGVDAAGVVADSTNRAFAVGDQVVVTGFDLGMNTPGGFGQYISVPSGWAVTSLPPRVRPKRAAFLLASARKRLSRERKRMILRGGRCKKGAGPARWTPSAAISSLQPSRRRNTVASWPPVATRCQPILLSVSILSS